MGVERARAYLTLWAVVGVVVTVIVVGVKALT